MCLKPCFISEAFNVKIGINVLKLVSPGSFPISYFNILISTTITMIAKYVVQFNITFVFSIRLLINFQSKKNIKITSKFIRNTCKYLTTHKIVTKDYIKVLKQYHFYYNLKNHMTLLKHDNESKCILTSPSLSLSRILKIEK